MRSSANWNRPGTSLGAERDALAREVDQLQTRLGRARAIARRGGRPARAGTRELGERAERNWKTGWKASAVPSSRPRNASRSNSPGSTAERQSWRRQLDEHARQTVRERDALTRRSSNCNKTWSLRSNYGRRSRRSWTRPRPPIAAGRGDRPGARPPRRGSMKPEAAEADRSGTDEAERDRLAARPWSTPARRPTWRRPRRRASRDGARCFRPSSNATKASLNQRSHRRSGCPGRDPSRAIRAPCDRQSHGD